MLLSTRILQELDSIPCKRCASTEGAAHASGQVLMMPATGSQSSTVTDAKRFAEFEVKVLVVVRRVARLRNRALTVVPGGRSFKEYGIPYSEGRLA